MDQLSRKRSTLLVILTTLIVTCIYFITSVTTAHAAETVKVGISAQSKPYNYHDDNGELTGFEIEVLEEVDQRLDDYSFTYDTTEFASLFAGLDAGKFDVIANNIGEKDERREKYLFSLYPDR